MTTSLLQLPARDELQLTPKELQGITGSPMRALQIEWLEANKWRFTKTRAGDPVVGRLYANLKMAGVDNVATMFSPDAWEPDFGDIG